MTTDIDFDKKFRHPDYPGVAWYIQGYGVEEVTDYTVYNDGEGDYDVEEIELVEDVTKVKAVMVGDDRVFLFDTEDMIELEEGDYCPECGQIGCSWG